MHAEGAVKVRDEVPQQVLAMPFHPLRVDAALVYDDESCWKSDGQAKSQESLVTRVQSPVKAPSPTRKRRCQSLPDRALTERLDAYRAEHVETRCRPDRLVDVCPGRRHLLTVSYTHLRAHETVLDLV